MVAASLKCSHPIPSFLGYTNGGAKRIFWCACCGSIALSTAPTPDHLTHDEWEEPVRVVMLPK